MKCFLTKRDVSDSLVFFRVNRTFALLLSKNERSIKKIRCFHHVFDSSSLLISIFMPKRDSIAISFTKSDLHEKPKS